MTFLYAFIGLVKSEGFDFDVPGDYNHYMPKPAYDIGRPWTIYGDEAGVFYAILRTPGAKRLDYGCTAVKMTVPELRAWLKERDSLRCVKVMLEKLDGLDQDESYLLTAVET